MHSVNFLKKFNTMYIFDHVSLSVTIQLQLIKAFTTLNFSVSLHKHITTTEIILETLWSRQYLDIT